MDERVRDKLVHRVQSQIRHVPTQGHRSELGARHGKGANVSKCVILGKEQVKYALDDFQWQGRLSPFWGRRRACMREIGPQRVVVGVRHGDAQSRVRAGDVT